MAYQQQYDGRPQPRQQQQYYDQGQQQYAGYDTQYDQQYYDYGYEQHEYEQHGWDDSYYNDPNAGYGNAQQQQQQHQQQQQARYNDGGAYGRQPSQSQTRRPPPQPHAQDRGYDNHHQHRPRQGQDPRRPMGRGDAPPPNPQQVHGVLRPPGLDRSLLNQKSPKRLPQDNAFPIFPVQNAKQPVPKASMEQAMSQMNINDNKPQPRQRRPSGRGQQMMQDARVPQPGRPEPNGRADSGQFEGNTQSQRRPPPNRLPPGQRPHPTEMDGSRGLPQPHQQGPISPSQQMFGPGTRRAVTMPQNIDSNQQQWADPGALDSYHGPVSPSYIPPRPSTAGSNRHNGPARQPHQQPPMPQMQAQQQQQYVTSSQQLLSPDTLYDDYNQQGNNRKSVASTIDMPDFDAIPETNRGHRRGDSIDNHLSPTNLNGVQQNTQGASRPRPAVDGVPAPSSFQQRSLRSRSQSDLNAQYNGAYEMAADAPPMPAPTRSNTGFSGSNGLPNGPQARGLPPYVMTTDAMQRGPPNQGYWASQQANFDPRAGRGPLPVQRGYSDDSAYSEPPLNTGRNFASPLPGSPMVRPGTAAPAPARTPSDPLGRRLGTTQPQMNPDALPAHPVPIRAGLIQQQQQQQQQPVQAQRPPPIRQYNSDQSRTSLENQPQRSMTQRPSSASHPVTYDELNRLRKIWKDNPTDDATGLKLAKKLVEAASVLAGENGKADKRTRDKNKEKFVLEAHKIVKKLAHHQYVEAMFYLADCYGQGLLGLQVDMKEAFTLYQSAAKAGHPASAYRTAVCCEMGHEEGGGTKRDLLKAVQWYRRAAALGDTPALYKMGMILLKGLLGQQKNQGEAINMLQRAAKNADRDNPHALHELALIYEQPASGNDRIIQDEAYSFQLFSQAADLGYKFSQFRLGQAYEYGLLGCPIDPRTSIGWYTKAAAQEEHQSELALSGWYLTGIDGVLQQSDTEAYLWARKAACAEPPLPKALFAMGYFTEVGIGCPRSLDEAKRWYGRAAVYKFPKAQERLEELKRGGSKAQMKRERLSRSNQKQQEENCRVM